MKTLLQIENLTKGYGDRVLFAGARLTVVEGQRIGIIGRNGAGKTTLCRLITGHETPDAGSVSHTPDARVAYLEQADPFAAGETALEFLLRRSGLPQWDCARAAARFQVGAEELHQPARDLSGGFQTRLKLTAMMLAEPNLLVLDEPSNYLDLRTLLLLESFLRGFRGGYLIVSHDRELLKRTCDHTLSVENGQLRLYPGDVESFLEQQEVERQQAASHNLRAETERKRLQRFVDRFRAKATKASQAQSKLKQIQRLQTIEIDHPVRTAAIRLPEVESRRGEALTAAGLDIGYSTKRVACDIHLHVRRGAHAAIVGDNGEGKTTLLRTLAGDLPALGGRYRWAHGLAPAFYAQHVYRALPETDTVLQSISRRAAPGVTLQEILDLAGAFLFRGDDLDQPIATLSGGERARVCLAGLLLTKNPVLLLDEPTNHLDFETVEALGQALRDHKGTLLFTSHDRTFMHLVATDVIQVAGGRVEHYPGGYEDYVHHLQLQCAPAAEEASAPGTRQEEAAPAPNHQPSEYELRKAQRSALRRLQRRQQQLETDMRRSREELEEIERFLATNPSTYSPTHYARLEELLDVIDRQETEWLELAEEIEDKSRQVSP